MRFPSAALPLFAGLAALLAVASLAGWRLRSRPFAANFNARVRAWWVMVALSVLVLAAGPPAIWGLFALLSLLTLREFLAALPAPESDHGVLALCFYVLLPAPYLLAGNGMVAWLFAPPVLVGLAVARARMHALGVALCAASLAHVPALLHLPGQAPELRIVFLMAIAQVGDVAQYLVGKMFGSTPIAPVLSPGKTMEGLMGGLIAAAGLGALLAEWVPFGIGASSLLGLGIGASGFLSGLVFSALKRQRGIKDWGTLLPGHGGMLDRLDSVCLTAPWFYWLLWFRFPGAP